MAPYGETKAIDLRIERIQKKLSGWIATTSLRHTNLTL